MITASLLRRAFPESLCTPSRRRHHVSQAHVKRNLSAHAPSGRTPPPPASSTASSPSAPTPDSSNRNTAATSTLFRLPSVIDGVSLVHLARRQAGELQRRLTQARVAAAARAGLDSAAVRGAAAEEAAAACAALRSLTLREIEATVHGDKYKLHSTRIATCIVPYQAAANIILARLPPEVRREAIAELREEEEEQKIKKKTQAAEGRGNASSSSSVAEEEGKEEEEVMQHTKQAKEASSTSGKHQDTADSPPSPSGPHTPKTTTTTGKAAPTTPRPPHRWIQWEERDVYVSTGRRYLRRAAAGLPPPRRTPVVCLLGHTGHGKTALLDALQRSELHRDESVGRTQTLRAFTVAAPPPPLSSSESRGGGSGGGIIGNKGDAEEATTIRDAFLMGSAPRITAAATTNSNISASTTLHGGHTTGKGTQSGGVSHISNGTAAALADSTQSAPSTHATTTTTTTADVPPPLPPTSGESTVLGTPPPPQARRLFTFIDTPGQQIFVESRFHATLCADCVLLVVSAVEGVEAQTHEAIKVALNLDKPIVVALTKMDQFTDAGTLRRRTGALLKELISIGLYVTLLHRPSDLEAALREEEEEGTRERKNRSKEGGGRGEGQSKSKAETPEQEEEKEWSSQKERESPPHSKSSSSSSSRVNYFRPAKATNPHFRGSLVRPVVDISRRCVGVCVSAARGGIGLDMLWRVLGVYHRPRYAPTCLSPELYTDGNGNGGGNGGSGGGWHTQHPCAVQAVVLESSKHLFDEEGFRRSPTRRHLQRGADAADDAEQSRFERNSMLVRARALYGAAVRRASSRNPTSSDLLCLTVVVREGVVRRGMHYVADQADGRVDVLMDFWGNAMEAAPAGTAVTIVSFRSVSGCPGAGTHVLSVPSEAARLAVNHHRRLLQWYAEAFSDRLHLLKPRGADASFRHLGDYGQVRAFHSLEYQLLYGAPPPLEGEASAGAGGKRLGSGADGNKEKKALEGGGERKTSADTLPPTTSEAQSLYQYLGAQNSKAADSKPRQYTPLDLFDSSGSGGGDFLAAGSAAETNRLSVPTTSSSVSSRSADLQEQQHLHQQHQLQQQQGQGQQEEAQLQHWQTVVDPAHEEALESAWRSLQPETPPRTPAEYEAFLDQCTHVGVLLKVDTWHSARLLMREAQRSGTGRVAFSVVGARFGPLTMEDLYFFGRNVRVAVCYRTPRAGSADMDYMIESTDVLVLQTDNIADVGVFLKWCAVDTHREKYPDEVKARQESQEAATAAAGRRYMTLLQSGKRGAVQRQPGKLLQYTPAESPSSPSPLDH